MKVVKKKGKYVFRKPDGACYALTVSEMIEMAKLIDSILIKDVACLLK